MGYLTQVKGVRNTISSWTGDGATNFEDNFLGHLPTATANQVTMARVLRFAAETNQKMHEQQRRDLKELATRGKAAMGFHSGCNGPSLDVAFGLAAGVLTIGAGIAAFPAGSNKQSSAI